MEDGADGSVCRRTPALAMLHGDRSLPMSPETAALVSHVLPNCAFWEAMPLFSSANSLILLVSAMGFEPMTS
jgi:hypothetical protein